MPARPRAIHPSPRPNSLRFRQWECGSDKGTCASRPRTTRFQYETPVLGPYSRSTTASGRNPKANTFRSCQTEPSLVRYWFFVFENIGLNVFGKTGADEGKRRHVVAIRLRTNARRRVDYVRFCDAPWFIVAQFPFAIRTRTA